MLFLTFYTICIIMKEIIALYRAGKMEEYKKALKQYAKRLVKEMYEESN